MSDREPVSLGYPYVESFHSNFSGSGGIDQSDRSTNIDEHTIEEMRQIASRYPDPRSALLPMLALGIPGSATAAVLLGGLMIWGLQPGPLLFVARARNKGQTGKALVEEGEGVGFGTKLFELV